MAKNSLLSIVVVAGIFFMVDTYELFHMYDNEESNEIYECDVDDKKCQYKKYCINDSIGQKVLDVTGEDKQLQFEVWNKSDLKKDFFKLFPHFSDMKYFIENHLRGEMLTTYLLENIERIENDFISGKMTTEKARREFRILQYK